MPADKGIRLDDRQRIANFREQPIETNEYHSVDGAEGEFLWSNSPQNVDLLPKRPNLCLKHYPRPDQIDNHPTNEPAKIPHCARSSSDSRSTAKQDKVCDRDSLKAAFVTKLQPFRLPGRAARQLPDQSTTLWVESSSTDHSRLRGALPGTDMGAMPLVAWPLPHCRRSPRARRGGC